jgi:hypothetical protein
VARHLLLRLLLLLLRLLLLLLLLTPQLLLLLPHQHGRMAAACALREVYHLQARPHPQPQAGRLNCFKPAASNCGQQDRHMIGFKESANPTCEQAAAADANFAEVGYLYGSLLGAVCSAL